MSSGWTWEGQGAVERIHFQNTDVPQRAGARGGWQGLEVAAAPFELVCGSLADTELAFLPLCLEGAEKGTGQGTKKGSNMYRASTVNQVPYPLPGRNSMMAD